jgi:hypothetical protein
MELEESGATDGTTALETDRQAGRLDNPAQAVGRVGSVNQSVGYGQASGAWGGGGCAVVCARCAMCNVRRRQWTKVSSAWMRSRTSGQRTPVGSKGKKAAAGLEVAARRPHDGCLWCG